MVKVSFIFIVLNKIHHKTTQLLLIGSDVRRNPGHQIKFMRGKKFMREQICGEVIYTEFI